ncbi:MAG: hypothetical protein QXR76_03265 [Candidatus Bathyarchaeia archaeon]
MKLPIIDDIIYHLHLFHKPIPPYRLNLLIFLVITATVPSLLFMISTFLEIFSCLVLADYLSLFKFLFKFLYFLFTSLLLFRILQILSKEASKHSKNELTWRKPKAQGMKQTTKYGIVSAGWFIAALLFLLWMVWGKSQDNLTVIICGSGFALASIIIGYHFKRKYERCINAGNS